MGIEVSTQSVQNVACDALLIGATKNKDGLQLDTVAGQVNSLLSGQILESYTTGEFKGNPGELLTLHTMGKLTAKRVLVVGLGSQDKFTPQTVRRASAIAARHLQSTGAKQIVLAINVAGPSVESNLLAQAQVEGALLGLYTFRIYQSNDNTQGTPTTVKLLSSDEDKDAYAQAAHKAQAFADGTNFARTLVNEPPNVLTPTELANRASTMAQQQGLECEVFNKEQITELRMGGLLAVSQGSHNPPHFIVLRYRGNPDSQHTLALVGKGITFDTGGISLKPAERMDAMKGDMGGAAAVLGAMQAIAQVKPKLNVTALVPTCENRPSHNSYLPGDIIRIMNGKTIEIVNTDAEGRLILADALSYATKEGLSPIIDLATLTGGIVVALGNVMTGLFCNDEQLTQDIVAAGRLAGEKYWPMPLDDEYGDFIKSDIADIKQTGGRAASSVTAAKILEHFVAETPWAHLDIAGTGYVDSKKPYQETGGTGFGVRTLAELALQMAQK